MMGLLRSAATVSFAIIVVASMAGQSSARPHPDEMEEMKKALYSACSGKNPITEEMKSDAKNRIFSEDRTFKCFVMCTLEELSLIDEEGDIDGDTLISMAPESIKVPVEKAAQTCLPNIAGKPDPCEVAFNFLSCGINMDSSLIQMLPL